MPAWIRAAPVSQPWVNADASYGGRVKGQLTGAGVVSG